MTDRGQQPTDKFAAIRRRLLIPQIASIENVGEKIQGSARLLSLLTGLYDEMCRISATYGPRKHEED